MPILNIDGIQDTFKKSFNINTDTVILFKKKNNIDLMVVTDKI